MISNKVHLEVKIENRVYEFIFSCEAPIGELYDALCQMRNFVIQQINAAHQASENGKSSTPVVATEESCKK